jgi:predicted outer membrane protein
MKKLLPIPIIILAAILLSFVATQSELNQQQQKTKEFLVDMSDARLMDREEGIIAAENGTTKEVKKYGELMVKDKPIF